MILTFLRPRILVALALCLAALAAVAPTRSIGAEASSIEAVGGEYIVVFRDAPLVEYRGGVPGIPATQTLPGRNRLDVKSPSAQAYTEYIRARQVDAEARIGQMLGRTPTVTLRTQHALNSIVMALSPAEAEAVRRMPDVLLLDPVRHVPLDTDAGPALIGAPAIWTGTAPGNPVAAQGEGMVIGSIDSGVNFGSPSFAAVDPIDGYVHVNPLGAGNYLGTCAPAGVDAGRCNGKLIGGYDFVCGAPGNQCGLPNILEEPGFGDTNGHGSHTASTVAGNRRDVLVSGNVRRIQGVAPRANVIAYDVCYTNTSTGQGLCPNTSSVAAVNQAVADGVVDAINFSIGGGEAPWGDAVSLAFLGAANAGIYVATSAGNSGPGPNTMGHHEPWTASAAAATHTRGPFRFFVNVTGPGVVPGNLSNIPTNPGINGVAFGATIPGTTPIIGSPNFTAPAGDGCVAYTAGTFAGAIALVSRGTCSFTIKTNNAAAAGAIAVVIANNAAGEIAPSVPGTTIPVFGILQSDGAALLAFTNANPTATAAIPFPATVTSVAPDVLASFSSRGPAANLDLMKPDVTAPGVDVLAAYAGATLTGFETLTGVISGTSMASPHNAGSALLLKQLKPGWAPMEVKSAIEMTTTRTVFKEDGVTPATPHDMGGGRIRVDRAANAGLVMNELGATMYLANPATGGNPATLNLPSFAKNNCVGSCSFTRVLRSPLTTSKTWTATVTGLTGTVSPSTFTVAAGGFVSITVTINTTAIPADGAFRYGWVELAPQGGTVDDKLTMPLGVTVAPPVISLAPATQNVSIVQGQTGTATYSVANNGGAALTYTAGGAGQGATVLVNTDNTGVTSGFRGTRFTNPGAATGNLNAQLQADDFTIAVPTTITSLFAQGFVVSGLTLPAVAADITWAIYPDAAGLPAGNPIQSPGLATWSYTATPASAGVDTTGNFITLNLPAAGQNVTLPPGKYWLMIYTRSAFADRWAWYGSTVGSGSWSAINLSLTNTGAWFATNSAGPPVMNGLAFRVSGTVPCNAPWIGATTPASGTLAGGGSVSTSTSLSAVSLAAGSYTGSVCFASNDPVTPVAAETFRLTVTPLGAGVASKLTFTTPPSSSAGSGIAFAQQPVVTVQDSTDATVTAYVTPVTLSVATGSGTLQCDVNPVVPVSGVATFTGCRINGVGTVTLRATSGGMFDSTTNPSIAVTGAASQLVFSTQPGNGTGGVALSTQPVVSVQDAGGNTVALSSASITLALTTSTGSTLTCTANPVVATAGVATFAGCSIDKPGTYTFTASSPGLPIGVSNTFTVAVGAPSSLVFSAQPGNGLAGGALTTQPAVSVLDAGGNLVSAATVPVTLSLNPSGTITCDANPLNATGGVATFSGCSVAVAGPYTLTATSAGLTSAISSSFTVGAKTNQAITFGALAAKLVTDADFAVAASASSGLAVTFASDTPAICTVASPATVHLVASGGCTIRATQAGNATYNPAPDVTQSFTVGKVDQTITFAPLAGKLLTDPDFTVAATASSGLAVVFGSDTPTICTVSVSTVHLVAQGTCTIRATQAGDATYNPATAVTRSFAVQSAARLVNMSTRMQVLTGNDVMIGGFVVGGTATKRVAIVATGPSLAAFGITNPLSNPMLTLVRSSDQSVVATNNDWQSAANQADLTAAGYAPSNAVEAAILVDLAPGAYTAIVQGEGGVTGVSVIGLYAVNNDATPLVNISTRGRVLGGNDVMIGGFVVTGNSSQTLAIVATGPSLAQFGITSPLANPKITLVRSSDQAVIAINDDWQTDVNASQLQAAGFAPSNALEAALYVTLPPGAYTAIVEGVGGATGVAVIGVYAVP